MASPVPTAEQPLVSVVIASHNQAQYLAESIESALGQTYPNVEVLVVDDGSTDESPAIAARYAGVRLLCQANAGVSAARNAGVAATTGELVVFLDSDDRLPPHALATGVHECVAHPDAAFVAGRYRLIDADGAPGRVYDWGHWGGMTVPMYERLVRWNFIGMLAAVIFRRAALPPVPFEPTLAGAEDWDLFLRITREHPVHLYDTIVAEYRRYGTSVSRNSELMLACSLAVLNRQREAARRDAGVAEAYREGMTRHCAWYGDRIVDDVLHSLRKPALRRSIPPKLAMLARYYPVGAMRRVASRVAARLLSLVPLAEGFESVVAVL
jgi:glycosyltransferase involved in cell wall biosynthesis